MPERKAEASAEGGTVVRVGSCDVHVGSFERLVAWHGPEALRLPAGRASAVGWSLRQAALRALAAPPRVGGRWGDIDVRGPDGGPYTLLFKGELARFADTVLSGDVHVTVTADAGRVTAFAVLTRRERPAGPIDDETEVRR
jgi:phosphopantetheinyl transferase (holo-ACP synthase)